MTMFCSECGKPCKAVDRDFGFGTTEFWGAMSTHINVHTVSHCCDGDVLDEPPKGEEGENDD